MNAQDQEALRLLHEYASIGVAEEHIRDRLTHLDKLERALPWLFIHGCEDHALRGEKGGDVVHTSEWTTEPHDGTPSDRAAALVRLWERTTGGA